MQSFSDDDDNVDYDYFPVPSPPEPALVDTTSIRRLWIGLLLTVVLFFPVYSPFRLLYPLVVKWLHVRTYYEELVVDTLFEWIRAASMLLIMVWDGAPLGVFGLKKAAWSMDTVTAVLTFVAHRTLGFIAVDLLVSVLTTLNYKIPAPHRTFRFSDPDHGITSMLLLLVFSLSIGLSEELVMRGYLIPRLERILKSKLWAILISAAFFGCWHIRNGIIAVWSTFWGGIIYGIVFVATRRLWPTVFAHALYDFTVFLRRW
jgi:membrane protease YdiL (CAAX protease family)